MMQRIITGVVAGGIFLALLLLGGAYFQILVALLVIIAMQELFRMYKLQLLSFEGILATLAALSLALPVGKHWLGLNVDGGVMLFTLFLFAMLTGGRGHPKDPEARQRHRPSPPDAKDHQVHRRGPERA